jgi:hypothetical protein
LRVLEKCNDIDERECSWIAKLREEGCPLLNIQPGGDYHTKDAHSTVELMKKVLRMWGDSDPDPEDVVFLKALIKQSETKIRSLSQRQKRQKRRTAKGKPAR